MLRDLLARVTRESSSQVAPEPRSNTGARVGPWRSGVLDTRSDELIAGSVGTLARRDGGYTERRRQIGITQPLYITQEQDLPTVLRQRRERDAGDRRVEVCEGALLRTKLVVSNVLSYVRADEPTSALLTQLIAPEVSDGR